MDANQTRFHLLLGEANWKSCTTLEGGPLFDRTELKVDWDKKRHELTLRALAFVFPPARGDRPPDLGSRSQPGDRRGAAFDAFGNVYWISEDRREVRAYSAGCKTVSHFWSSSDRAACVYECPPRGPSLFGPVERARVCVARELSGLTVTEDHYLVSGTIEPAGILIFDLHAGGPPQHLRWPEAIEFAPFDMAPRPGGGVWILDREHARYWGLDRGFRVIALDQAEELLVPEEEELFQPESGETLRKKPAISFPVGIQLENGSPIDAFDPVAIEALPDGTVLILDANRDGEFSRILRYDLGVLKDEFIPDVLRDLVDQESPAAFRFHGYDFAFVPDPNWNENQTGKLYIVTHLGNQAFSFELQLVDEKLKLEPHNEYLPMRLFGGKGLIRGGQQAHYDFGERWVPLVAQVRARYETSATILTPVFDGREPQCVWHRLFLDGCLPPETEVRVWSRAGDEVDLAESANPFSSVPWQLEPSLYKRSAGSELPYVPSPAHAERGTFELLFQKAKGRYLQLRLELLGSGRATPRLRALRIYYPRFSYVNQYLPAIYREDTVSASFLDRFLANIEGTNTAIEDRIAAVQMLFDVRSAPSDALEWLASWFGMALDPAWDERRQRLFIQHAMEFFEWRGTIRGLQMALRLAFEEEPNESVFSFPPPGCLCADRYRIIEHFRTRQFSPVAFGDPTFENGPRFVSNTERWSPQLGVEELRRRYEVANPAATLPFDINPVAEGEGSPDEEARRAAFAERELGFVPSNSLDDLTGWQEYLGRFHDSIDAAAVELPQDEPIEAQIAQEWREYQVYSRPQPYGRKRQLWQQFLASRYPNIHGYNTMHGTHWTSFDLVAFPPVLPGTPSALHDWFQFEAVILPMLSAAHSFSVLLPVPKPNTEETRRDHAELARRLVELEKPAHTVFNVKFYWALFRLGEARLGSDSIIGLGGRDPALLPPAVLGQSYLAESYISAGHPYNVRERHVLGRDRLSS